MSPRFQSPPSMVVPTALAIIGVAYCLFVYLGVGESVCITAGCSLYKSFNIDVDMRNYRFCLPCPSDGRRGVCRFFVHGQAVFGGGLFFDAGNGQHIALPVVPRSGASVCNDLFRRATARQIFFRQRLVQAASCMESSVCFQFGAVRP